MYKFIKYKYKKLIIQQESFRKILIRDGYAQINEKIHVKNQIVINLFIVVGTKESIIGR
jgi:hypothetical protein